MTMPPSSMFRAYARCACAASQRTFRVTVLRATPGIFALRRMVTPEQMSFISIPFTCGSCCLTVGLSVRVLHDLPQARQR